MGEERGVGNILDGWWKRVSGGGEEETGKKNKFYQYMYHKLDS